MADDSVDENRLEKIKRSIKENLQTIKKKSIKIIENISKYNSI